MVAIQERTEAAVGAGIVDVGASVKATVTASRVYDFVTARVDDSPSRARSQNGVQQPRHWQTIP